MNDEPIILIGPLYAGKTTVGKLLAEGLGRPFVLPDRTERPYQKPEYLNPDLNEILSADDHFNRLVKHTFYTNSKTPAQTCQEILAALNLA